LIIAVPRGTLLRPSEGDGEGRAHTTTSRVLGISRNGLAMKMERLGLGLRNVAFDADALIPRG
jgi:hypothetical protein